MTYHIITYVDATYVNMFVFIIKVSYLGLTGIIILSLENHVQMSSLSVEPPQVQSSSKTYKGHCTGG